MTPTPRATRLAATAAAALLAIGGLAACTDDSQDPPSSNQDSGDSSTNDSQDDAPGTDQSKAVFDAYSTPKPLASTTNKEGMTFDVLEVKDTPDGTLLSFRMTDDDITQLDLAGTEWASYPVLADKDSGTAYQPITLQQTAFAGEDEQRICLCTARVLAREDAMPQYVLYESLPDDLDKVQVRYEATNSIVGRGFEPVTVNVSR
ncbi:hypothetical protein [Janibacter corallicola]|uniref:hypothetical protein n=1 Tax=Janibacter corallicola TaxID=415212 RepID=UPI0008320CD9|nr:hypothetical protein [Janibacter corallicola]